MESLTQKAKRIFANDHYATDVTGITINYVESHSAECQLELTEKHHNARGVAMGGVIFIMADFAAAIAANSDCLEDGNLQWVSLDATIHYLSPATGTSLKARSSSIKHGRTSALYQTIISDAKSGHMVAVIETTMMHLA